MPVQHSSDSPKEPRGLSRKPAPELVEATRQTARSDGGSVGSNLKKLSIDDRQGLQHSNSPPAAARTKRAAEPSNQVPDGGEKRPLKRQGTPHTTPKDQDDRRVSTNVNTQDSNLAFDSQRGVMPMPPQLQSKQLRHFDSDSGLYSMNDSFSESETKMLLQPETRPITQDQLVNEVKGIYAGLVMVEKKCVEIDQQQSKTTNKLTDEQWQALIALHRTLLYEHHDFFLASQHPSSSAALRRLATKYAMPARMWRHGIHSFLELLRHRLPDSLDHMRAFVYLAYSMMAILLQSVPSFVETWIECLGDLARYRMAIEEIDLRDREIWSGCAKMWYEKAADKSPKVGRIQHHLAVLARPNIVQQLFYYSKALVSEVPFQNARESILLLFNPFLPEEEIASQKYIQVEAALVTIHAVLFSEGSARLYWTKVEVFLSGFDSHIGRTGSKFRTQGPEIASSLCAAAFFFGVPQAYLMKAFHKESEKRTGQTAVPEESIETAAPTKEPPKEFGGLREYWKSLDGDPAPGVKAQPHNAQDMDLDSRILGPDATAAQGIRLLGQTTKLVTQRIGDKNIVPYMHVLLAFLWSMAHVPDALLYIEGEIPWEGIVTFLNTLGRSGVDETRVVGEDFPQQLSGTGRQLPEDFPMRGLIWAQYYYPPGFFEGQVVDEDERTLDLPSQAAPRAERCLWLGVQIGSVSSKKIKTDLGEASNGLQLDRWFRYDRETRQFAVSPYGHSLSNAGFSCSTNSRSRSNTLTVSDNDIQMMEVQA